MDTSKSSHDFGDIQIVEDKQFGSGEGGNFKKIILTHYNNCMIEGSKEMTTGGVMKRLIDGEVVEFITPNQIMIFVYHVDMLKRALVAEIPKYSDIVKQANTFEDKRRKINNDYNSLKEKNLEKFYSLSSTLNHELGYSERDLNAAKYKRSLTKLNERYYFLLLNLYQEELFPCLTRLLARKDYFDD